MTPDKKPQSEYHDAAFDDVRTIPSLYDTLRPYTERTESLLLPSAKKSAKKRVKKQISEKIQENTGDS